MRIRQKIRLAFDCLEDRATPATFTVTTIVDNGSNLSPTGGSLRAAVLSANANPGDDTIAFNITGGGVQPITPALALPAIVDTVVIDGTTQPGFSSTPVIRLDGGNAGAGAAGLLLANHTGSVIRGLTISHFADAGIRIVGGGSHVISGNQIGTTQNGTAAAGNGIGIVAVSSQANQIGGTGSIQRNVISGNDGNGIRLDGGSGSSILGNFIGTDLNGTAAVANQGGGIALVNGATGNTVGGTSSGSGNVIAGNGTAGVILTDAATAGNTVAGNRIGLSFSGGTLANAGPGLRASAAVGTAPVGGVGATTANVLRTNTIQGNTGAGIAVLDTSRYVRIEGNSIDANGGLGLQVDATANDGLAAPLITSIKAAAGSTQLVSGTIVGRANTAYSIGIFTSPASDASGSGEGRTSVGTAAATTDVSGNAAYTFTIPSGTTGSFVTATATATVLGDTSAFSKSTGRPGLVLTGDSFAVGAGAGGAPTVNLYDSSGLLQQSLTPFDGSFTGGVRVATADFSGDGVPDVVIGTGIGIAAQVKIINPVTSAELFNLTPFGTFTRGVFVATGDITGDGKPDLVITPDEGGGPRVRVFDGTAFTQIADFFGIQDVNFRGGARATIGDLTGDDKGEVIVSAGFGGGPRVAVFDGATLNAAAQPKVFGDFFVFEQSLRNGAYVAAGDVNNDGIDDLVAGAGPGGGPRVRVLDGKVLRASGGVTLQTLADFFGGDSASRGGVRVTARDIDGDGRADVVTGGGLNGQVNLYNGTALLPGSVSAAVSFSVFGDRTGGVFVG